METAREADDTDDLIVLLRERDDAFADSEAAWLALQPLIAVYQEARARERAFAARFLGLLEAEGREGA